MCVSVLRTEKLGMYAPDCIITSGVASSREGGADCPTTRVSTQTIWKVNIPSGLNFPLCPKYFQKIQTISKKSKKNPKSSQNVPTISIFFQECP